MSKTRQIVLSCGVAADTWTYQKFEYLDISLIDVYNGYGPLSDFNTMAALFGELAREGYTCNGISRVEGYYDSTDDLIIQAKRPVKK